METYTTTAAGRTVELEIVENAPRGYAVNFHQIGECIGLINFHAEGFEAETSYTESGQWIALGVFADRFEALGAVVQHLEQRLERLEDADDLPAAQDPADADELLMDLLDPEVYGDHYGPAARRDILRRAAYDMGINDRRAHAEMLPVIARRAADMIRDEMAPMLLEQLKQDAADELAAAGWTADPYRTAYSHPTRGHLALNFYPTRVAVYLEKDQELSLSRDGMDGTKLAQIITAATN
ncbi:hypothetical protein PBI_CORAL_29 [Arthrobacter phage Coral]|uniref:Uncharacterized protein n=3 Tax=Coralvirus coral TaxID=2734227 RepID=A0A5J6TSR4_9CAUD|nr:hypothetical protein HOU54_gp29 [Arthrobacter phage Coral]AYN57504.1 hypothetical protein PBI_CORAL_29 [Arthrobacter phage Coral]AYN58785.1 hypothetical protein PBI_POLKA_29 [Arthrobacter phage Polka]QFG13084.1 hypothetical protein PBI_AMELIA_30 [Arthrobacter phage Amelia]